MKKLTTNVLAIVLSSSFVMLSAQEKKSDSLKTKDIGDVVLVGYRKTTKKRATTAVATIGSKAIENRPASNAISSVQGQIAGVNISSGSGQPGSTPTSTIRGASSVNGNTQPLYVIDGFPTDGATFMEINPNDVAKFTVLKDAVATAQYGSRGANGVYMITTKSGRFGGGTSFRYSSRVGVSLLQDNSYNHANSRELLTLEKRMGIGKGNKMTWDEIDAFNVNTNWRKVFFRTGFSQSHNFSVTTGSKNLNSFTSVSYSNDEGILQGTDFQRLTLRNKINGRTKDKRFNYSLVTGLGFTKSKRASSLGSGSVNLNPVLGAYKSVPYIKPSDYTSGAGVYASFGNYNSAFTTTPLLIMDRLRNYRNSLERFRMDLTSNLSYAVTPELTAKLVTAGQVLNSLSKSFEHPDSFNEVYFNSNKEYKGAESGRQARSFTFDNLAQLNYKKTLGDHSFVVSGNVNYKLSQYDDIFASAGALNPKTFYPGAGTGWVRDNDENDFYVPDASMDKQKHSMLAYFGSVDYDFSQKYGFVGTIRRDGSSRFDYGYRWGTFWSVGARWNVSEEDFMQSVKFVNDLKVRSSYGTTGNENILGSLYGGYFPPAFYVYNFTNNPNGYGNNPDYNITNGYEELRWETTKQFNVGLDFKLFKNRLTGTFDYYNKKTVDLYIDTPRPPVTGSTSVNGNSEASLINKGFELGLKYKLINKGDFRLTINANGAINNQNITDIVANEGKIDRNLTSTRNGHMLDEFFLYRYAGVNKTNGNLLFLDKDGNLTEAPTLDDRVMTGYNSMPKYQGGFGFDAKYKSLFMKATFTYAAHVKRFDYDLSGVYSPKDLGNFNVSRDLLDAWTPDNTNTNIPSLNAANYDVQAQSDRFLRDASYIRLRNVQIGASIPKKMLKGTFVKNATITLQAENLVNFTKWRGFDPESNRASDQNQYPTPRIITMGLDVKF